MKPRKKETQAFRGLPLAHTTVIYKHKLLIPLCSYHSNKKRTPRNAAAEGPLSGAATINVKLMDTDDSQGMSG